MAAPTLPVGHEPPLSYERGPEIPAMASAQGIFNGALLGALAWIAIGGTALLIQSLLSG